MPDTHTRLELSLPHIAARLFDTPLLIDPAKYRTREEVEKMKSEKDAIEHVRDLLLNSGLASDEDLKAIDKSIKEVVNASAEFAKASPEPALSELWTDIYA